MVPALRWRLDSSIVGIQAKVAVHQEASNEFFIPVVRFQSRMARAAADSDNDHSGAAARRIVRGHF